MQCSRVIDHLIFNSFIEVVHILLLVCSQKLPSQSGPAHPDCLQIQHSSSLFPPLCIPLAPS